MADFDGSALEVALIKLGKLTAELDALRLRARAVVDARYEKGRSWEELKDAIASLADIVGGGEP